MPVNSCGCRRFIRWREGRTWSSWHTPLAASSIRIPRRRLRQRCNTLEKVDGALPALEAECRRPKVRSSPQKGEYPTVRGGKLARRTLLKSTVVAGGVTTGAGPVRAQAKSKKKVLKTDKAAAPIGPYSQGIQIGNLIFVAGEKGLDPKTGKIVPGGIKAETRQTLENIKAILAEAGATFDDAVASTVHMTNLKEFQDMNEVYAEYFRIAPPGRTTVEVSALPGGAHVEITVIAAV